MEGGVHGDKGVGGVGVAGLDKVVCVEGPIAPDGAYRKFSPELSMSVGLRNKGILL
jgi:hypothetical protein